MEKKVTKSPFNFKLLALAILVLVVAGAIAFNVHKNRNRTEDFKAFQLDVYKVFCSSQSLCYRSYDDDNFELSEHIAEGLTTLVNDSNFMEINCGNLDATYRSKCKDQQSAIRTFFIFTDNGEKFFYKDKQYLTDVYNTIDK